MGNTINPTALRLGWSKGWIDSYYTKELYYPQLLHKILKLRFILTSLLIKYWRGRRSKPYLFSHLIINKLVKNLHVSIYFYDTLANKVWDNFYSRLLPRWSRIKVKMLVEIKQKARDLRYKIWNNNFRIADDKPVKDKVRIRPLRLRGFFILMFAYLKFLNNKNFLTTNFHIMNWRLMLYYTFYKNPAILKESFINYQKNFLHHLLIVHSYFKNSKHGMSFARERGYIRVAKAIIKNAFTFTWTAAYMRFMKTLLLRLCRQIFSNDLINFNFYRVNNVNTNALFIAKFIARRLLQGNRLYDVINPIKKELKWRIKRRHNRLVKKFYSKNILANRKKLYADLRFKTIKILEHHKKNFNLNFFINKTFVNYESLRLLYRAFKDYKFKTGKRYNPPFKVKFNWYRKKIKVIYYKKNPLKPHIKIKPKLHKFYRVNSYLFLAFKIPINSIITLNNNVIKDIDNKIKRDNFLWINNMLDDLHNNWAFTHLVNRNNIMTVSSNYNINEVIKLSISSFIKSLQMNFTKYLIQWEYEYYNINKRDLRNKAVKDKIKDRKLLGFKLQLKGRFSRKQIAANHVFQTGTIGLNTIMGNLDYGFATIPLYNSAVGIKVWLNWQENYKPVSLKVI